MCQTPCVRAFELWSRVRRASGTLARLAQVWGGAARWSPHRRASAGRAHTRLSLFVNLINLAELVKHTHTHTHTRTHTHKSSLSLGRSTVSVVCRLSRVTCASRPDTHRLVTHSHTLSIRSVSVSSTDPRPWTDAATGRDTPPHAQARQPPRQSLAVSHGRAPGLS